MSRHHLAHRNPAMDADSGRIFIRVPQGKVISNRNLRADLISYLGAGNVYLYWIGDGKHVGAKKEVVLCAWKIDEAFDISNLKDCRAYPTEQAALSALRSNYMGNTNSVTLYQVFLSGNRVNLATGSPFVLDRLPPTDPDRQAAWQTARPYPFPLIPEGVAQVTPGQPQTVWYGHGMHPGMPYSYPPPVPGYPYPYPHPTYPAPTTNWMGHSGTPTAPYVYPPTGTPMASGYVSGNQITPQQALERVMIDVWARATKAGKMGPAEFHGWSADPRKSVMASDYVGFSLSPGKAPTAELVFTNRPWSIDPIPEAAFPSLIMQLWNNLADDAKKDPTVRVELKKQKKAEMFNTPYMIQWRILEPVQRGDIRYYICQWKFAYEPHMFEVSGTPVYKTF